MLMVFPAFLKFVTQSKWVLDYFYSSATVSNNLYERPQEVWKVNLASL